MGNFSIFVGVWKTIINWNNLMFIFQLFGFSITTTTTTTLLAKVFNWILFAVRNFGPKPTATLQTLKNLENVRILVYEFSLVFPPLKVRLPNIILFAKVNSRELRTGMIAFDYNSMKQQHFIGNGEKRLDVDVDAHVFGIFMLWRVTTICVLHIDWAIGWIIRCKIN